MDHEPGAGESDGHLTRRQTILWVEDDLDTRECVTMLLSEYWDVIALDNGQAALDAARECPPDLILADVMMDGLDANDLATLRQSFAQPPREAGRGFSWFWWNSVVSREEIAHELGELAAAGFAGAELRVVTFHGWGGEPLDGMDSANLDRLGHRQLKYLSDEWLDMMEFTCATAERLGLRLAINLGQGWPLGGPWITDQHRSKHLAWKSQEVEGRTTFVQSILSSDDLAFDWRLSQPGQSKTVESGSFQDLTRFVQRQDAGGVLRWEVPEGRWLIGLFSVTPGGICDKGDGPEVDPGSREAVLFHLNFMFSRLDPKLGRYYGTTQVDAASDSWEFERPEGGGRY